MLGTTLYPLISFHRRSQTGVANGILALLLVNGSLVGFGIFHAFFGQQRIQDMYGKLKCSLDACNYLCFILLFLFIEGLYVCIVVVTTILTGLYAHDRDAELNAERGAIDLGEESHRRCRRRRRQRLMLGPYALAKTMLYDPIARLDANALISTYTIDTSKHHDFFVVTVSRLFYYCGVSVQTFFMYFLHDIIHVKDDPESAVAYLAVLGQVAGSFICYPIGLASDRVGKRKPFVYFACAILGAVTLALIFAQTMRDMTILCCILGAANGIYLTVETSMAVDTLPDDYEDGPSGGHAQLLGSKC